MSSTYPFPTSPVAEVLVERCHMGGSHWAYLQKRHRFGLLPEGWRSEALILARLVLLPRLNPKCLLSRKSSYNGLDTLWDKDVDKRKEEMTESAAH